MTLDYLYLAPIEKPAIGLVILMHGVGADKNDLFDLARYWQPSMPGVAFASVDAPHPFDMAPQGRQWFSLNDRSPEKLEQGIEAATPILNETIDHLIKENEISPASVVLVGFSQGTMMALNVGLRRSDVVGVVGYSGGLFGPVPLDTHKPPFLLVHGEADPVVPAALSTLAKEELEKHKINVDLILRPGLEHGIDDAGLEHGQAFLKKVLDN